MHVFRTRQIYPLTSQVFQIWWFWKINNFGDVFKTVLNPGLKPLNFIKIAEFELFGAPKWLNLTVLNPGLKPLNFIRIAEFELFGAPKRRNWAVLNPGLKPLNFIWMGPMWLNLTALSPPRSNLRFLKNCGRTWPHAVPTYFRSLGRNFTVRSCEVVIIWPEKWKRTWCNKNNQQITLLSKRIVNMSDSVEIGWLRVSAVSRSCGFIDRKKNSNSVKEKIYHHPYNHWPISAQQKKHPKKISTCYPTFHHLPSFPPPKKKQLFRKPLLEHFVQLVVHRGRLQDLSGEKHRGIGSRWAAAVFEYPIGSMGLVYLPRLGWFLWFPCREIYQSHGLFGHCYNP